MTRKTAAAPEETAAPDASKLTVEYVPIDAVIPYERNPRHNEAAVAKVAASIKEFGFRQPIVVDPENVIVVGHTRLLAARELGLTEVPIHIARNLSAAQVKAYRLADNRTAEEAEWDAELLALELGDLDAALLPATGFDDDELAELLQQGVETSQEAATMEAAQYLCVVTVGDERALQAIYEELKGRGFECTLVT